jgi:hypothetical protein
VEIAAAAPAGAVRAEGQPLSIQGQEEERLGNEREERRARETKDLSVVGAGVDVARAAADSHHGGEYLR